MTTTPHTTPEGRAELRRRYGSPPTGVVRCTVCQEIMGLETPQAERVGILWTWRCPRASEHRCLCHIDPFGDLDVLAAVDDADTLDEALEDVTRLRTRIQDALDTSWGDRGGERSAADALDDVRALLTSALNREPGGAEG